MSDTCAPTPPPDTHRDSGERCTTGHYDGLPDAEGHATLGPPCVRCACGHYVRPQDWPAHRLQDDRAVAAYHEAGHAIAGAVLRQNVLRVQLDPPDGAVGGVFFREQQEPRRSSTWRGVRYPDESARQAAEDAWRDRADRRCARQSLVVLCAGPLAAERVTGTHWRADPGAAEDYARIREAAEFLAAPDMTPLAIGTVLMVAERDARALLDAHWPAVERVVEALLSRGTLSGRTLRGLVREARIRTETGGAVT